MNPWMQTCCRAFFSQCLPARESFPGRDPCCLANLCPQIVQEASIKLVNLQFYRCALPKVTKYPLLLSVDPFVVDAISWIACAVVVHTMPNNFYIIERPDRGVDAYQPFFFKHDNASGLQKGCVRVKPEDEIVAILFRKSEVKPLWPNSSCTKKAQRGQLSACNPIPVGDDSLTSIVPKDTSQPTKTKSKESQVGSKPRANGVRKMIIKAGKLSPHAIQLSPLLARRRHRSVLTDNGDSDKAVSAVSFFSQEVPSSGIGIPILDSDEGLAHDRAQAILHQHLDTRDDPASQFSDSVPVPGDAPSVLDNTSLQFAGEGEDKRPLGLSPSSTIVHPLPPGGKESDRPPITECGPVGVGNGGEPLGSSSTGQNAHTAVHDSERIGEPRGSSTTNQQAQEATMPVKSPVNSLQPTPNALISLFDGCGSTFHIFKDSIGYPPHVFLAAEWDQHLRAIVADALGLALDGAWRFNKFHSKSCYISDVDQLFLNDALILRQFVSLLPEHCRVFVVGGSPCTELTTGSSDKGLLGLSGPASCLFFNIHLLLFLLQTVLPRTNIRFLVENAGSMLPIHSDFIRWALGIEATPIDQFVWDASALGLADRKRFFFQNVICPRSNLEPASGHPFPQGWGPLPFYDGNKLQFVTAEVFMRTREEINDGLVHRSWSAYHPYSLVWDYSFFGSVHNLATAAQISSRCRIPQLVWSRFIPGMFLSAWNHFLQVVFNFHSSFKEKDNAIYAVLRLFHNPRVRLPFRLISAHEAAVISGIHYSFSRHKISFSQE